MPLRLDIARCAALAIATVSATAYADGAIPLRLRYDAPPECPGSDLFFAAVVARTPLARAAAAAEDGRALRIVVKSVPGGSTGTLELAREDATTSLREVSAADCEQVVAALALMTALAIDPHATTGPIEPAPPAPAPAPAAPPNERAPAADGEAEARATSDSGRLRFEVGAQLEALGGIADGAALLLRPFVQLAGQGGTAWGYALRLSGARARGRAANTEGQGSFTLWTARVEPCASWWPLRPLALSACVPVDVGQLEASGIRVVPSERVRRPWVSIGGLARVEWVLFDVLVLEAAAQVFFPVVRDRFYVGSSATLHRAPVAAGGASIGMGVRFP
jgi:hypothetical protein